MLPDWWRWNCGLRTPGTLTRYYWKATTTTNDEKQQQQAARVQKCQDSGLAFGAAVAREGERAPVADGRREKRKK